MPFVAFEGIDGCGKSTLLSGVAERLLQLSLDVISFREPGSTPLGERIRSAVLDKETGNINPWSEACLFTAARAELVHKEIRGAVEAGRWVLLDRYFYSTLAYQGYGFGLDVELLRTLNHAAISELEPDLVVWVDVSLDEAVHRREGDPDRVEDRDASYTERVRRGYERMCADDPNRWLRLDGQESREALVQSLWTAFEVRGWVEPWRDLKTS